jgi:nucleotide-binding universal stress UspA family protein
VQNTSIFPNRVLLAIDDSEETALATHKAVSLADSTGSELHVVYVGQLPNRFMEDPDILGFNRKIYDEIERDSLEVLWRLTLQVKAAGGVVDGAHLRMGNVAEEIVGLARDLEADLIVMGSRGHGGVRRAVEGSISDQVVRRAPCPVMTVRADKGEEHRGFWRKIFSSGSTNSG